MKEMNEKDGMGQSEMEDSLTMRQQRARELFVEGYNCSQAVFCTFANDYGIADSTAKQLSASFGGGVGHLHEMCGTCSAMALLEGLRSGMVNANDSEAKRTNYANTRSLIQQFDARYSTHVCRELLLKRKEIALPMIDESYRLKPCMPFVDSAVEIWWKHIHENTAE